MLTSKQRSELRAQSNGLDTTLIIGKDGVTENTIAEADRQLTARELIKCRVLENAMMSPREVSDTICEATGAEGIAVVGSKFVLYRFSEKKQAERNKVGRAKLAPKTVNPVKKGVQARPGRPRPSGKSATPISSRMPLKRPLPGKRKRKQTGSKQKRKKGKNEESGVQPWGKSAFTEEPLTRPTGAICWQRGRPSNGWSWTGFC